MMTKAVLAIKQWGNNLGVRLPAAVAKAAHLHVDQRVRISVKDCAIVIRPVEDAEPTLDQRLARFNPVRHGGEVMQSQAVGLLGPSDGNDRQKANGARGRRIARMLS
jgi:antitoxin MazE